jgi:hypothetical protein
MDKAFILALNLCEKYEVFDRPLGLAGRWGLLVEEWLDLLLPADAHEVCKGNVTVLVTNVGVWPVLKRQYVSDFRDRDDLIQALLASIHIPFFMDTKFSRKFRGVRCVDGSFLSKPGELEAVYAEDERNLTMDLSSIWRVDHNSDSSLKETSFVQLKPGPDLAIGLMKRGRGFAEAERHFQ